MDVLIFVVIFGILPQIIKGISKKQDKKNFKSADIEDVKKEFEKVKARFKDFKISSALEVLSDDNSHKKVEISDIKESEPDKTFNNQVVEKTNSCAYESKVDIDEKYNVNIEKNKSKVRFKGREDLKRAVIMSEILGKPKALKDHCR